MFRRPFPIVAGFALSLLCGAALAGCGGGGHSDGTNTVTVYQTDFEQPVGSEWSSTARDVTPVGERHFLGQFGNDAVTLTVNGLPSHAKVTVSFDLYVIRSWDGDGSQGNGPDIWTFGIAGWPPALNTTFSNYDGTNGVHAPQHYPDAYPGTSLHSGRTGTVENDTLGYFNGQAQDAVYHMSFTIPHSGDSVSFRFAGSQLEALDNESWGLDNVMVQTVD